MSCPLVVIYDKRASYDQAKSLTQQALRAREETPFCNVVSKRKEQRVEMIYCGDISVKAFSHP